MYRVLNVIVTMIDISIIVIAKIFLRKDITLTRNHEILFCIQKPTTPPI